MINEASPRLPDSHLAFLVCLESVSGQAPGRLSALRDRHQLSEKSTTIRMTNPVPRPPPAKPCKPGPYRAVLTFKSRILSRSPFHHNSHPNHNSRHASISLFPSVYCVPPWRRPRKNIQRVVTVERSKADFSATRTRSMPWTAIALIVICVKTCMWLYRQKTFLW